MGHLENGVAVAGPDPSPAPAARRLDRLCRGGAGEPGQSTAHARESRHSPGRLSLRARGADARDPLGAVFLEYNALGEALWRSM